MANDKPAETKTPAKPEESLFDTIMRPADKAPATADKPPAATADKPPAATADKPPVATADKPPAATADKPPAATADKPPAATGDKPVEVPPAGADKSAAGTDAYVKPEFKAIVDDKIAKLVQHVNNGAALLKEGKIEET